MFDIVSALLGLIVLSPLFLMMALLIAATSPGPIFFRQERIGQGFRPFQIYKFRTMVAGAPGMGAAITAPNDVRITPVGRLLRASKMDELPQLINVLKGEMSLVGPRPEVRKYVDLYTQAEREILSIRPGITDWASIHFRHEEVPPSQSGDIDAAYVQQILPRKLPLQLRYVHEHGFGTDLQIIAATLRVLFFRRT
jgi:lipopolysaccharide/colanic/teichoic acid biosynthesis glycosyltransferase